MRDEKASLASPLSQDLDESTIYLSQHSPCTTQITCTIRDMNSEPLGVHCHKVFSMSGFLQYGIVIQVNDNVFSFSVSTYGRDEKCL